MQQILKQIDKNKKLIFEDANLRKSANARMLIDAYVNYKHNGCESTELTLKRRFSIWESTT